MPVILDKLNALDLSNPDQQKEYIDIVINEVIKPLTKSNKFVIGIRNMTISKQDASTSTMPYLMK